MSIDIQADLQNVERARELDDGLLREERDTATAGGARYRNPITTTREEAGDDLDHDRDRCQNCGRKVPPSYHRGQSDNDGILWHCGGQDGCVTATAMKNGAGAKPDYSRRCNNTGDLGGGF